MPLKPSIQTTPFSGFIADRKPCGEPHVWGLLVHLLLIAPLLIAPLLIAHLLIAHLLIAHPLIAHLLASFWLSEHTSSSSS